MLALLYILGAPGFWSGVGWAQQIRQAPRPIRPDPPPVAEPTGGALGTALASCDKESQSADLILPSAKGDLKLDRCYRGRDHLVCSFNALLKEARSLLTDYQKIVDARYPELGNVEDVCSIKPNNLAADMENATVFGNRFRALKAEYNARIGCANKIDQSLNDVTLSDMTQASKVLKSMIDAIEGEVNNVSTEEAKVVELAEKIGNSQKAMVAIQKIHRSLCLQSPHRQENSATR
jgi:hypothetical protein